MPNPPLSTEIETLIAQVEATSGSRRDRARRLIGLGEMIAEKGLKTEAYELCRKALAMEPGDSELLVCVRRVLARLIPSYHVSMMNDTRRNSAWERALTRAIRPGMRALEIGTGAGILALIAARAGAYVYTCEDDPVIAAIAREIVVLNGLTDRITIIEQRSQHIDPAADLGGPADLLFCDIFTDSLLGFEPLATLVDARRRLLTPGAPSLPSAGSIRVALANWEEYSRLCHIDRSVGFNLAPMMAFVPEAFRLPIIDPSLALMSDARNAFQFDFTARMQPKADEAIVPLKANRHGQVNGIVQWIRLELDHEAVLEARPNAGFISFSSPLFYPLVRDISVRIDDIICVNAKHDGRRLTVWA